MPSMISFAGSSGGGGGSGNAFTTIQTDMGTSPVATGPNDTLTLTSSDGSLDIIGDATTDTVDFKISPLASSLAIGSPVAGSTDGSVLFIWNSGTLQQDNPNFFWDNMNNYLGIGTATPDSLLDILLNVNTDVGLTITAAASQTGNLIETYNDAGDLMTIVRPEYGGIQFLITEDQIITTQPLLVKILGRHFIELGGGENGFSFIFSIANLHYKEDVSGTNTFFNNQTQYKNFREIPIDMGVTIGFLDNCIQQANDAAVTAEIYASFSTNITLRAENQTIGGASLTYSVGTIQFGAGGVNLDPDVTLPNRFGFTCQDANVQSGGSLTNNIGFLCNEMKAGSNFNVGFASAVSAGPTSYNFIGLGDAASMLTGKLKVAAAALIQPTEAFEVGGNILLDNVTASAELRIAHDGGGNYTGFKSPSVLAASVMYVLPIADGLADQVLTTDGSANLSWSSSAFQLSRVSTQFDATATTALADVTGLTADVVSGKSYRFKAMLFFNASLLGGAKYAIAGAATASAIIYNINSIANSSGLIIISSRQTALGGSATSLGPLAGYTEINGLITASGTGTLTVQFAQSVASGTSSVLVGSTFEVAEVA